MYKRSDKRRIYEIIDLYLSEKIDESTFSDEFDCSYNLEIDYDELTENEKEAFSELEEIESRFSEFEEDHEKYPGAYNTKEELRQKIIETHKKLGSLYELPGKYKRDDKRRIYELINLYFSGKINESEFKYEFHFSYNFGIDHKKLTKSESQIFLELEDACDRFCESEDEYKKHLGLFYSKKELRQEISKAKIRLEK